MLDKSQHEDRLLKVCRTAALAMTSAALMAFTGCHFFHHSEAKATVVTSAHQASSMLPVDLTKVQPNEAGKIPIIMFHNIVGDKENDKKLQYPPAMFRADLQWMYDHNYRPVSLTQFAEGKIDCPAGMSPVILTFDDGLKTQYNITSDGKIDPNCAVGILEAFHAQHSDWPLRGTFFVLTDEDPTKPPPFYQKEFAQGKMEHLVQDGFDIGNHTVHHKMGMEHMADSEVLYEFAGGVAGIHKYLPDYDVDTLALPYGVFPKNRKLLESGSSNGTSYKNICALDAAWQPEVSPMSPDYKPFHLERVMAGAGFHQSRWWFNYLQQNQGEKFVSDGDPNTYTISQMMTGDIDKAKVEKMGFHFRTYNGTQMVASK